MSLTALETNFSQKGLPKPTDKEILAKGDPRPVTEMACAAMSYAEKGHRVFPCDPATKRPLTGHGFKDASNDGKQVKKWWRKWPNAMIGMPTGNGLLVLDVDPPTGFESLAFLEKSHSQLPATLEQVTPRGGRHLHFRTTATVRNSAGKIGRGLDIRADGGYVILAPSVNGDGRRYAWTNEMDPVCCPEWLLDLIKSQPMPVEQTSIGRSTTYGLRALEAEAAGVHQASEGQRNAKLNQAAFKLGQLVAGGELVCSLVENNLIDAALGAGLSREEAQKTLQSGLFSGMKKPRRRKEFPASSAKRKRLETKTGDTGNTGDMHEDVGTATSPDEAGEPGRPGTGFFVNFKGLYFNPEDADQDPVWISSPLMITAMTRNTDSETWGRLLELDDPDGHRHVWACPLELLAGDGSEFRRILLSMGLQIAPGTKARHLLANYVQTFKVEARAVCTDRTGWHGQVYVLPDETIGLEDGDRIVLQSLGDLPRMRQAGTSEEWCEHVARLCAGNSRLALAVSAAFAAPLLNIIGDESGGLHLTGGSSTGKTTVLRVAASVWGGSEHLHRWRATSNGLEAIAQAHNDGLLILDELAQVDPREAGEIAYMLANGSGKHRARKDGLARKSASWRLLFLSAGEIGLADHMQAVGRRARAGQEVRLSDVPADAGRGHGIFEDLHGFPAGGALAEHLCRASTNYHGTVGRDYLHRLVHFSADRLFTGIGKLREGFLAESVPSEADGQARRVASRLALIAAGGEIATSFGLTGWEAMEATNAAAVCYRAWLDRRGGAGSQEEATALAQVRYFLEAHGEARFTDLDKKDMERPTISRAGYRRTTDNGIEYLVLSEVFKQDVCAGLDFRLVARVLRDRGLLKTDAPDRLTIKTRKAGRVYCILEDRS